MMFFRTACLLAILTTLVSPRVVKQDGTVSEDVKEPHQSSVPADSFPTSVRTMTFPVLTHFLSLPFSTELPRHPHELRDEAHERAHKHKRAEVPEGPPLFDDPRTSINSSEQADTAVADLTALFDTVLSNRDEEFNNNFLNCNFNAPMTNWCRNHFGDYCTSAGKRQQTREYTGRKSQICEDDCHCHRIASINDCLRQYIPLSICVGASADIIKAIMETDELASSNVTSVGVDISTSQPAVSTSLDSTTFSPTTYTSCNPVSTTSILTPSNTNKAYYAMYCEDYESPLTNCCGKYNGYYCNNTTGHLSQNQQYNASSKCDRTCTCMLIDYDTTKGADIIPLSSITVTTAVTATNIDKDSTGTLQSMASTSYPPTISISSSSSLFSPFPDISPETYTSTYPTNPNQTEYCTEISTYHYNVHDTIQQIDESITDGDVILDEAYQCMLLTRNTTVR